MGGLLPATLDESNQIRLHDGPADTWSGISADVLLTYGANGPDYYAGLNEALARALPIAHQTRSSGAPVGAPLLGGGGWGGGRSGSDWDWEP